jgi:hypothetical protein
MYNIHLNDECERYDTNYIRPKAKGWQQEMKEEEDRNGIKERR